MELNEWVTAFKELAASMPKPDTDYNDVEVLCQAIKMLDQLRGNAVNIRDTRAAAAYDEIKALLAKHKWTRARKIANNISSMDSGFILLEVEEAEREFKKNRRAELKAAKKAEAEAAKIAQAIEYAHSEVKPTQPEPAKDTDVAAIEPDETQVARVDMYAHQHVKHNSFAQPKPPKAIVVAGPRSDEEPQGDLMQSATYPTESSKEPPVIAEGGHPPADRDKPNTWVSEAANAPMPEEPPTGPVNLSQAPYSGA